MLNKSDEFYGIHQTVLNELEVSRTLLKNVHCFRRPQALVHLETPSCLSTRLYSKTVHEIGCHFGKFCLWSL